MFSKKSFSRGPKSKGHQKGQSRIHYFFTYRLSLRRRFRVSEKFCKHSMLLVQGVPFEKSQNQIAQATCISVPQC